MDKCVNRVRGVADFKGISISTTSSPDIPLIPTPDRHACDGTGGNYSRSCYDMQNEKFPYTHKLHDALCSLSAR